MIKPTFHTRRAVTLPSLLVLLFLLLNVRAEGQPPPKFFYTDWTVVPGKVYYPGAAGERTFFQAASGRIYSAAVGPDGALYYADSNTSRLMRAVGNRSTLIYNHTTYLRDIAFDPQGRLYFSEATGAGGDGRVYRLTDGVATLFFTVSLAAVNGFWAGDFAFAPDGKLYLSTGNRSVSHIYRVDGSTPTAVFNAPTGESVAGFDFDSAGNIYYADWFHRLYKLTPAGVRTTVLENGGRRFADVAVVTRTVALGPEAGRVNSVATHPTNANILYAGASGGGVFRSYNGGQFWEWRGAGLADLQIGTVLVYPPAPTTVFAATPTGVFRSTNEGASWSQVLSAPLSLPPPESPYPVHVLAERKFHPLRYDPASGALYAAPFCAGLFMSTDGGTVWTQTYGSSAMPILERCVTSVDVSAAGGGTVFITTLAGIKKRSGGAGGTWTDIAAEINNADPLILRVAPSGGGARVYVLANRIGASPYNPNVWRRDSLTGAFEPTTLTPSWSDWFPMLSLAVHPTNPDLVYAGSPALYRSINAGADWNPVTCSSSLVCGADYRGLTFSSSGGSLYAAHDQGVYRYDSAGGTFTGLDEGLVNTQFYDLDVGPAGTVYTAGQDVGGFRRQGINDWEDVSTPGTGDVLDLLVDPTNNQHLFIRTNTEDVLRSSDGGLTSTPSAFVPGTKFWNHQLAYHPATTTLYAGTTIHGVYKSTNDGASFSPANGGIESREIRCLALAPGSDQIVYAGTMENGVYKTGNGGMSWAQLMSFPQPGAIVIAISPAGDRIYAGTTAGVYQSNDGGTSWTPKNTGLPGTRLVSELIIDPVCPCMLYAGLGFYNGAHLYGGGVYGSSDGGNNWSALTTGGDAAMSVTSLRIDPLDRSRLYVATHGSGVRSLFRDIKGGCTCP